MNIAVLALGRSTHEIEFAQIKLKQCLQFLYATSHKNLCELPVTSRTRILS